MTAATDSSLASLLVADSPSHNTSTQTTVFIASTHRLYSYRLPETTHHRASTNTLHTSLTTLERRYDRFVIHDSNHRQHDMTGLQSSRLPTPTAHCLDPGARLRSRFQAIDDSRQSSSSKQSTRAQSLRLPSNRREHKVFVFQAIDESTKSSSSKQSTRAQSLRLPSNRRQHKVFVFQAIDERSSTNTLNDEHGYETKTTGREHRATHAPTTPTSSAGARSCAHNIARTHAPRTHTQTQTATNCMPVSRTNSLSLLNGNKKKKKEKKRKRIKNDTHHTNTNYTKRENVRVSRLCSRKNAFVFARPMSQFKRIKKRKKKRKCLEVHCCLCSTQSRTNK